MWRANPTKNVVQSRVNGPPFKPFVAKDIGVNVAGEPSVPKDSGNFGGPGLVVPPSPVDPAGVGGVWKGKCQSKSS